MDKILKYSDILTHLLADRYKISHPQSPEVRAEIVIDRENHHYILMYVGWEKDRFYYFSAIHFDIIGEKIWIQQNNTEDALVDELESEGVDKSDIVLAFLPPEMRVHTGFALA